MSDEYAKQRQEAYERLLGDNGVDDSTNGSVGGTPPPDPPDGEPVVRSPDNEAFALDPGWWDRTPVLAHIRDVAHHRVLAPAAVLGCCLARVVAWVPPNIVIPPIVVGDAAINLGVIPVGASGTGKSGAWSTSADVLAVDDDPYEPPDAVGDCLHITPGSGEGLVEAFYGRDSEGKRALVRNRVVAYLDEGTALSAIAARNGSTSAAVIRSMLSGTDAGHFNADPERRRQLPAGRYRFALVVAFQPALADALLADVAAGTPQRFMWVPSTDPTIPDNPPEPGRWRWQAPTFPTRTRVALKYPDDVVAEVRHHHLQRQRGEDVGDPLDSHRLLVRLKIAAAVAFLHGRPRVDPIDWELAGDLDHLSGVVRDAVIATVAGEAHRRELASHLRDVRRQRMLADANGERYVTVLDQAARIVAARVYRDAGTPVARRLLIMATGGRHRAEGVKPGDAIADAITSGWIVEHDHGYVPGPSRPAP